MMEKMVLKPSEVSEVLGIGRTRAYELLSTGELPSIRIGKSIRIPVTALKQWMEERQSENGKGRQNGNGISESQR